MRSEHIFKYSYEQMERKLLQMKQAYPGKISLEVPALSVEGRKIYEAVLGSEGASHHVLIQAGMHGREYLNSAVVMRQVEAYLQVSERELYKGKPLKELYEPVCFHVLPMVNPDGVKICQKGSFVRWKANARGVDINRNFDAGWEEYEGAEKPSSEGFKGDFPGSEPETRAILNIAEKCPIDCCIAYHSSGNVIYWDYGSEGMVFEADRRLAKAVAKITGYPLESTVESGAEAAGCSDYFVKKCGIPAVTIETGSLECPLPNGEFEIICRQNQDLWPEITYLFAEKMLPC